jgi:hypothetical protein
MPRRFTPSPAMVVALLALFASLAGGAHAATNLPGNSVGTGQLRSGAVTHPKLAGNSVWHATIGRHSVRNINLAPNAVWHANIGTRSVRQNNIANEAVGSAQILPHAVGALQLDVNQPWRNIGAEGQAGFPVPDFQNGWRNAGLGPSPTPAGFTVDADQVAHLRGQVAGGTVSPDAASSAVFTLPAGERPADVSATSRC